ncbi:DUF1003 domain-containing protein [Paenibacillus zeisoli]|uniref:DUF1003 domain-containing protein n=1 Tax=Paenibacillus zeisoli TaxID=2496267 RepID=A0A433XN99_9BACL|nr:DUF1003 domain-containing protein [Paenibacillus zeisoli]RUT35573.1 DUF1003 domain-containing protein [Paenibacillus zeisoli]
MRKHSHSQPTDASKSELNADELLFHELEQFPEGKLDTHDIHRLAKMVNEYQGKIKAGLLEQHERNAGTGARIADKVAIFGGSWKFIFSLAAIMSSWLIWNHSRSSLFILSFILSIFTVFQATLIQMSQNRQAVKDKQEQIMDIAINYKAEKENVEIQNHLLHMEERLKYMEAATLNKRRHVRRNQS